MSNIDIEHEKDPIAFGIGLIGEKWAVNVIVSVHLKINRFTQLQKHLNISPSVLNDKLIKLVNNNILRVISRGNAGRATAYEVTSKGMELLLIVNRLKNWYLDHRHMEQEKSGYREFVNIGTYLTQYRADHANDELQASSLDP